MFPPLPEILCSISSIYFTINVALYMITFQSSCRNHITESVDTRNRGKGSNRYINKFFIIVHKLINKIEILPPYVYGCYIRPWSDRLRNPPFPNKSNRRCFFVVANPKEITISPVSNVFVFELIPNAPRVSFVIT